MLDGGVPDHLWISYSDKESTKACQVWVDEMGAELGDFITHLYQNDGDCHPQDSLSFHQEALKFLCPCQSVIRLDPQQHLLKTGITIPIWWVNKLTQRGKTSWVVMALESEPQATTHASLRMLNPNSAHDTLLLNMCSDPLLKDFTFILIHSFDLIFPRRPYQFPILKRVWGKKWE